MKERVLNPQKRSMRRSTVSMGETVASITILLFLVGIALWVHAMGNRYDPAERDIDTALLVAGKVEDTLYRTPLKRWSDPALGGTASAQAQLGIFPEQLLDDFWKPSSRVQTFSPETLYEKINGAAEQYLQFGFQALHYVSIAKESENAELNIELYDMGNFPNALGLFAAQRDASRVVEPYHDAWFYKTEIGAIALLGQYYLKIAGNSETDVVRKKAHYVMAAMAGMADGATVAERPFTVLAQQLQVPLDRIAYERSDVFQYEFARNFWFGYPDPENDVRFYLHEAQDAAAAEALFKKLLENNRFDFNILEESAQDAWMEHKYLKTFTGLQWKGRIVLGVENAVDRASLENHMQTLRSALMYAEES